MLNIVPNNSGIPNFIDKTGDSLFLGDHIARDLLFWKNVDMTNILTNMITGLKTNTPQVPATYSEEYADVVVSCSIIPSKQKWLNSKQWHPGCAGPMDQAQRRTNRKKTPTFENTFAIER